MSPTKTPNKSSTTKRKPKKLSAAALADTAMSHGKIIKLMSAGDTDPKPPYLGHAKAIVIVCAAANTSPSNLSRSLAELGVNGIAFQKSVFVGVTKAGYTIKLDDIPDSPDTTLIQVVTVIQNAKAI